MFGTSPAMKVRRDQPQQRRSDQSLALRTPGMVWQLAAPVPFDHGSGPARRASAGPTVTARFDALRRAAPAARRPQRRGQQPGAARALIASPRSRSGAERQGRPRQIASERSCHEESPERHERHAIVRSRAGSRRLAPLPQRAQRGREAHDRHRERRQDEQPTITSRRWEDPRNAPGSGLGAGLRRQVPAEAPAAPTRPGARRAVATGPRGPGARRRRCGVVRSGFSVRHHVEQRDDDQPDEIHEVPVERRVVQRPVRRLLAAARFRAAART